MLAFLLLLSSAPAPAMAVNTIAEASEKIPQHFKKIEEAIISAEPKSAGPEIETVARIVDAIRDKSIMIFGDRRKRWEAGHAQLRTALAACAHGIEQAEKKKTSDALASLRKAWTTMKAQYPAEALETMPPLWTCPMHPEVMKSEGEPCPTCGMALDPLYVTQPNLSRDPVMRSEIVADAPLSVGKKADLRIRLLFNKDGKPVSLDDLEETHTRKIHLLIIDLSQSDYHHEHPEPAGNGEYAFSFTPRRPGPYRVWADLKPVLTRVQQYAVVDVPAEIAWAEMPGDEPESREAEVNSYKFHLAFEKPALHAGDTVLGKLTVTDAEGAPFTRLEVVMGTFGHLVGFPEYPTVLHIHPIGPEIEDVAALGGPELQFYFRAPEPGIVRLFTQVQIGGHNLFPRFIVHVRPRPQLVPPLALSTPAPSRAP